MGYPERLVQRQLRKGRGDLSARVRALRLGHKLGLFAAVMGLCNSVLNLWVFDKPLGAGWVWVVLGLGWLGVIYVIAKQHRYLNARER